MPSGGLNSLYLLNFSPDAMVSDFAARRVLREEGCTVISASKNIFTCTEPPHLIGFIVRNSFKGTLIHLYFIHLFIVDLCCYMK